MTKALAWNLGPDIRVNAVAPGFVRTPRLMRFPQPFWDEVAAALPLRRPAEPEDIAKTLVFLVSDMSTCMTGAVVPCDGGIAQVAATPNLSGR